MNKSKHRMAKPLKFETKILMVISTAMLVVLGLVALTWQMLHKEQIQAQQIEHTREVLSSIAATSINTLRIESYTRAYILTGDTSILPERKLATLAREDWIRQLQDLTRDNPYQQQHWQDLRETLDKRKRLSEQVIELRDTRGLPAARDHSMGAPMRALREHTVHLLRAMEDEEQRLLAERSSALQQARTIATLVGSSATIILLLLLAATYTVIRQQVRLNRESQMALEQSNTRSTTMLNTVGDGILTINSQGIITTVNPAAERIFGYHTSEMIGHNVNMLMPEPYHAEHDGYLAAYAKTGEARIIGTGREVVGRRRDGSTFPLELAVNEMWLDNARYFTGVTRDISRRKRFEQAQIEREHFLKTLIDSIPGMVGYWNVSLHCEYANTSYLEWFGRTPEQMRGITIQELLGEALFAKNEPYIRRALQGETQHFERTLIKADGTTGYTWAHYVPFVSDGIVKGFFVLVSDITEIKLGQMRLQEINAELISARDEANRANQAKSEFLSNMSHELRTPMNAILGFGQLMEIDSQLSEDTRESVKEILKAGRHLLELINEVLDLAKIEAGHIDISQEPVDVNALLDECINLMTALATKRDIQLRQLAATDALAWADRTRLRQALLNLLSNAIKYNRDGGSVTLHVQIMDSQRIRIEVTDTGQGIPLQRIGELFQPFQRLHAEGSGIEGTGIGLTITQRVIELMGGRVGVETEYGVGSTFWIELPSYALQVGQVQPAAVPPQDNLPRNVLPAAHWTVLYIEDNPSNLKLMAHALLRFPQLKLLTAHTPQLGIDIALARQPDLILLDINMPGMDGYRVLSILKADPGMRGVPIIAVTANAMQSDIEQGRSAGFAEYLTKPIDVARLYAVLQQYLNTDVTNKPLN